MGMGIPRNHNKMVRIGTSLIAALFQRAEGPGVARAGLAQPRNGLASAEAPPPMQGTR